MSTLKRLSRRVNRTRGQQSNVSSLSAVRVRFTETRFAKMALAWLFSAFLLFGQGVDLSHSHDGDLTSRIDCEICFVTGTLGQAVSASSLVIEIPSAVVDFDSPPASLVSTTPPTSKARAPPVS